MEIPDSMRNDGHRLLQVGGLLILLGLLVGLGVQRFTIPRLGLSTHLLGIMQGILLIAVGQLWPKLKFERRASRIGHVLAIYGCLAAWTANLLGAIWGAGSSLMPIAAGGARGTDFQEGAITILLLSAAISLVTTITLMLWGLRVPPGIDSGG